MIQIVGIKFDNRDNLDSSVNDMDYRDNWDSRNHKYNRDDWDSRNHIDNKDFYSEFNSSLESILFHVGVILDHFDLHYPNLSTFEYDLKSDNDRFKILSKAVEYLPIDEELCEGSKLEIEKIYKLYVAELRGLGKNGNKETILSIREDIEKLIAPVLMQIKRLELSSDHFNNVIVHNE